MPFPSARDEGGYEVEMTGGGVAATAEGEEAVEMRPVMSLKKLKVG